MTVQEYALHQIHVALRKDPWVQAVLLAAGTAFCPDGRKHPGLWAALALLLAGLYMLLTFTPPGWGPFVNPLG